MARYLSRPEVISLAGGLPDPETFPVAEIALAAEQALAPGGEGALQYGATRGAPRLVAALATMARRLGLAAGEDQVFVTAGSQQGLDLVARAVLDPGDTVVVETPTYAGALAAFRASGASLRALASGGVEPDPEDVDRACTRARAAGSRAKLLYLVPNFQNPAGTTLTIAARHALLAAAARNGLIVVEDDPYRELWFEAPPPPPIASLEPLAPVIYLGSLSKVLAPGLRLGFAIAPPELCPAIERLKEAADLCTSTLSQAILALLLERDVLGDRLVAARALYRRRRDAMIASLEAADLERRGVTFTRPAGGFFSWIEAPGIDGEALLERAIAAGVAFVIGAPFHGEGGGQHTLRLAFSRESEERIAAGVARLAPLLGGRERSGT
jgi:2-aminoadipate transaminase